MNIVHVPRRFVREVWGGTETVIRCEVTADRIQVTATDLSGKTLPQPPSVKARSRY